MLAVAAGGWALFGRDDKPTDASAIGPKVPTSAPTKPGFGPVAPGTTTVAVTPTSTKSVAAHPAATATSSPAPSKAPVTTAAPTKAPTVAPPASKPVINSPVSGPQQAGTVAKKDYTFKVARGDTLWDLTEQVLADTGRPTLNANVVAHLATFYQLNQKVIGSDPDLILPGQVLVWPIGL